MSDSGRQIGDCKHARPRQYCGECETDEKIARLMAVNAKLLDALVESVALNVNWSREADASDLEYYSEYRSVIKQAKSAIREAKEMK